MDQRELAKLARSHAPNAIARIVDVMENSSQTRDVLKACEILLMRGYGKGDKNPLPEGTKEETLENLPLDKRIEVLRQALAKEEKKLAEEMNQIV